MKKLSFSISIVIMLLMITGCNESVDRYTVEYEVNEPVFMSMQDFRDLSVGLPEPPREIEQQGKICFYNGYLYISEPEKGIHIIDNRNPANPVKKGFVEIMGNHDLAIRDDVLYADALIDLVWFDLSDPVNPRCAGRLENMFPRALPSVDNDYGWDYDKCWNSEEAKDHVVVGAKVVIHSYEYEVRKDDNLMYDAANSVNGSSGVNGSYSLFNVYQKYLYTVVENDLVIFDLSSGKPIEVGREAYFGRGWEIETVFVYGEAMFLGSPRGMFIYSLEDPLKPEYQSTFWHFYGCDPVVVEDNLAYVTVRSGTGCGQSENMLYVVDITDLTSPQEIVAYRMVNPKGLGIDNKILFVCDDGLKIYEVEDPQTIMSTQLAHMKGMNGHDVIPYNDVLMMIADDAIYQYDYKDPGNIKQLSKLSFK